MGRLRFAAGIGVAQAAAVVVVLHGCNLDLKPFVEPDATPLYASGDATTPPNVVDGGVGSPDADASLDSGRDGGGADAGKRVFVTSTVVTGAFGGINGADKLCQDLANAAKLNGSFMAWVSSVGQSPLNRLRVNGPWFLVDRRTRVFASKLAITATGPEVPIQVDETGRNVALTVGLAWTGTTAAGLESPLDQTCLSFTSETGTGMAGETTKPGPKWTESGLSVCSTALHIYCFEQ